MSNKAAPTNLLRWFDPRFRSPGTWGFILNRITALGLTLYLALHLVMLFKLSQGEASYDEFIAFASQPVIKIGEMLVIAAGLIHGLNGIRIGLTSFGIGVLYQRAILIGLMVLAILGSGFFALKMFSGA